MSSPFRAEYGERCGTALQDRHRSLRMMNTNHAQFNGLWTRFQPV
jgi:hypothetical protein